MSSQFVTWNAIEDDHPGRALAKKSYGLVATGNKEEWLKLFTDDAVVMDPVGPSFFDPEGKGHHGKEGIANFWDTAIAMVKKFHFTVNDSFANGNNCANVAVFTTTLEDGTTIDTELVAVYEITDDGTQIKSMKAYWEPDRAMATARKEDA